MTALEKLGEMERKEGETAMPPIGAILAVIQAMGIARQNRLRAEQEVYQQQICPKCQSVVGMMRPRASQDRTFCLPCQAYRKIVPEDLRLSEPEWAEICAYLDAGYREWKRRGSRFDESVGEVDRGDPQVPLMRDLGKELGTAVVGKE